VITLQIPRATPSMNATHHKHWRVMYAQKKLWECEIWAASRLAGVNIFEVAERAKVTIERFGRTLDVDNFLGGLKSVIDGLKSNGLIVDDNAEHLELVATQHKGTPRTVIRIEPQEPPNE
jgi:hypothetical protein